MKENTWKKKTRPKSTCTQGGGRVPRGPGCSLLVRSVLWYVQVTDQQKDDTMRPDGRQDNKIKEKKRRGQRHNVEAAQSTSSLSKPQHSPRHLGIESLRGKRQQQQYVAEARYCGYTLIANLWAGVGRCWFNLWAILKRFTRWKLHTRFGGKLLEIWAVSDN